MPDVSATYGTTALGAALIAGNTYYLSQHTTDPGITGVNEVTGGSYARQPIMFSAAATSILFPSGFQESTNSQSFTGMPAESGNLWFGIYDAVSAGNFQIGSPTAAVTGPITSGSTVNYSTNAILIEVV